MGFEDNPRKCTIMCQNWAKINPASAWFSPSSHIIYSVYRGIDTNRSGTIRHDYIYIRSTHITTSCRKINTFVPAITLTFKYSICIHRNEQGLQRNGAATPRELPLMGSLAQFCSGSLHNKGWLGQDPSHYHFFIHNSNSMAISFHYNPHCNEVITTKICTCHDSCAVVACAKICSDLMLKSWMLFL